MIQLQRESLQIFQAGGAQQHTWPLKVTATADVGATLSPKIFVYHAFDRGVDRTKDIFEAVASVHQMNDLPEDAPAFDLTDPSKSIPFYRVSSLTFHCLSPEEAEHLWEQIQEDTNDLIQNHLALTQLVVVETINL